MYLKGQDISKKIIFILEIQGMIYYESLVG